MADAATSVRIQSDPSRVNVKMASPWLRIRDLALVSIIFTPKASLCFLSGYHADTPITIKAEAKP